MNRRQNHFYLPFDSVWGPDCIDLQRFKKKLHFDNYNPKQKWMQAVESSIQKVKLRVARKWSIQYPSLPILDAKPDIENALKHNQVILVTAGTGSGKSTQLPKICMEMGLSSRGRIGITQPRRLAVHAITSRLIQETGSRQYVGCQTRFVRDIPPEADIKVMTDGILLQECRKDSRLSEYQTLIIDEVHERNLNIDVIMGMLKLLLKRRNDLKVILSSATMETEMLAGFFENAPIIKAEGRCFPVSLEYCEAQEGASDTILESMQSAILDLQTRKTGHLLAFLPTERDIQELKHMLEKHLDQNFLILTLFGRLPPAEQALIFKPQSKTKIILSTNIAETSVTIPDITYVVDSGLARISRYHRANRIQGLPIEPISQASANQRAGRAGRTKPGTCIRIYPERDFNNRPPHTEPEINRSNLANVALQLLSLNIKDLTAFPLPSPPQPGQFKTALKLLEDLGAITHKDENIHLTAEGYRLSTIPLDVTLGKMILNAKKEHVLEQAVPVIAAASLQDPKILPSDPYEKSKAKGMHSRFSNQKSDILAKLNLYIWIQKNWQSEGGTLNKLRKLCLGNYLHFMRVREWFELTRQLQREWRTQTLKPGRQEKIADALHRSILSGLPGQVAQYNPDKKVYKLAGGKEVIIFPGSGLKRAKPPWVASISIRETSRTFLTDVFTIDPQWMEKLWPQACKRSYFQAGFNPATGFVEARETVSYMGLVLPQSRRVQYQRIDPTECAQIFWTDAIAGGQARETPAFHRHNIELIESLTQLEEALQQDLNLPYPEEIARHYLAAAPGVTSMQSLNQWLKNHKETELLLKRETYVNIALDSRKKLVQSNVSDQKLPSHLYPSRVETCGYAINIRYGWRTNDADSGIHLYPNHGSLLAALEPYDWWRLIPGFLWNVLDSFRNSNTKLLDWNKYFEPILESMFQQFKTPDPLPPFPAPPETNDKDRIPGFRAENCGDPEDVCYNIRHYPKQHLMSISGLILNALDHVRPPCSRAMEWPNPWPKSTLLHIHFKDNAQKNQLFCIQPDTTSLDYWQALEEHHIPGASNNRQIQNKACKPFGAFRINWLCPASAHGLRIYAHPLEMGWEAIQAQRLNANSRKKRSGKSGRRQVPSEILWTVLEDALLHEHKNLLRGWWKSAGKKVSGLPVTPEIKKRYQELTVKRPPQRISLKNFRGDRTMKSFEELTNIPRDKEPAKPAIGTKTNKAYMLLAWCIGWGPEFFLDVYDKWFNTPPAFPKASDIVGDINPNPDNHFLWALAARQWSQPGSSASSTPAIGENLQSSHANLRYRLSKYCDFPEWHALKKTEFWKKNESFIKHFRKILTEDKFSTLDKIRIHITLTRKLLKWNQEQLMCKRNEAFGAGRIKRVKVSESALENLKAKFRKV